jgi:site-specific DNA-methyltransferase (adenine-specific)
MRLQDRGRRVTPYYEDARATLYRGDALAVLRELPDASVDAVITDPPYSSGGMVRGDRAQPGSHRKYSGTITDANVLTEFTGDSRDQRAYGYWCALWLGEAMRVTKPGGVALLFTDWRQLPATTDAIQSGGWVWRGIVPWVKQSYRPQSGRLAAQCEYVVWGSAGPMPVDHSAPIHPGFFQGNPPRDREHITQKPVEIMRELVKIVPVGGTVLDLFMGSGTTGVAAITEGRKFVGSEMTAHYSEVAERRIRIASGHAVDDGEQAAFDFGGAA